MFHLQKVRKVDWDSLWKKYLLGGRPAVGAAGLNYMLGEMIGEQEVSHQRAGGGEYTRPDILESGLLGADFEPRTPRDTSESLVSGRTVLGYRGTLAAPRAQPARRGRRLHRRDRRQGAPAAGTPEKLLERKLKSTVKLSVNSTSLPRRCLDD